MVPPLGPAKELAGWVKKLDAMPVLRVAQGSAGART